MAAIYLFAFYIQWDGTFVGPPVVKNNMKEAHRNAV